MESDDNEEFRRMALYIALTSGLTRRQVAADLGVRLSTLNNWLKALGDDRGGLTNDMEFERENERLRRENRMLREERELLRCAIRFFAAPEG